MKITDSIGANAKVDRADSTAENKLHCSIGMVPPVSSDTVSITVIKKYTNKNWHVKFTTHWTVGDTGCVSLGPGDSKRKIEAMTPAAPP